MAEQKIDISQIKAHSSGELKSDQTGLHVEKPVGNITALAGNFDAGSGTLTLEIPGLGQLQVSGFASAKDLGHGPEGKQGKQGRNGVDGMSGNHGRRGADGCEGPRGAVGSPGKQGPRGQVGPPGPTGPTGATGPRGEDGSFQVYIQEEDPVIEYGDTIKPGAIWVRP